jgi:hypothetical protein
MLILNTLQMMRLIRLFHLLTSKTLDGKQMSASFKSIMLNTDHIVRIRTQTLSALLKSIIRLQLRLMRSQRRSMERRPQNS